MRNKGRSLLKNNAFQSIVASLICIVLGLLLGFVVLLLIKPSGAVGGITALLRSYFKLQSSRQVLELFTQTLVKTVPLIMCSLSILFCYKVGLFNIGAAGQYCIGIGISLYAAISWRLPWWVCMLMALAAGAIIGCIVGLLKAYRNVNEVISGIMLNWMSLYIVNIILKMVKKPNISETRDVPLAGRIPSLGLDKLLGSKYASIAIPMVIIIAVAIYILLEKTKFGYELKATGFNKNAAKYAGMAEKRNIIVTLAIGGALAGLGAAMFYLTNYPHWETEASTVPAMGFNGIAAAFLGGLNPIGSIFSSFFIQHITEGGAYIDNMIYASQISDLIFAIIIYLCSFVLFIKSVMNRGIARNEKKRAALVGIDSVPGTGAAFAADPPQDQPEASADAQEALPDSEDRKGGDE